MIITEPAPSSPSKQRELSPLIGEQLSNRPPAYVQHQTLIPYSDSRPEYRRSPTLRFFKAFCVAIIITALLSILTSSVVWLSADKAHRTLVSAGSTYPEYRCNLTHC